MRRCSARDCCGCVGMEVSPQALCMEPPYIIKTKRSVKTFEDCADHCVCAYMGSEAGGHGAFLHPGTPG